MPKAFEPWPVADILHWLEEWQGVTLKASGGDLLLDVVRDPRNRYGDRVSRKQLIAEVSPHITARKAELLAYFAPKFDHEPALGGAVAEESIEAEPHPMNAEAFDYLSKDDESGGAWDLRLTIIRDVFKRAAELHKPVWWLGTALSPGGKSLKPDMGSTSGKCSEIPPTARYLCVEGETKWTALPKVAPDPIPIRGKKRAPRSSSSGERFSV